MKQRLGLVVIAVCAFALTSTEAKAQAVVMKGAECKVPGLDDKGNWSLDDKFAGDGTAHIVRNGNVTVVVCRGRVVNKTGRAQNFDNVTCMGVPHPDPANNKETFVVNDARLTISASGNAVMRCRVKASDL